MNLPTKIEIQGIRVLTTRQLATAYETSLSSINNNFSRNKKRYIIGKHYIPVEGDELKMLRSSHQIDGEFKGVPRAYLWTEKGALLHAKSLNTDKAWEVYDYLVDFYFRAKEVLLPDATSELPVKKLPNMGNPIQTLHKLLDLAEAYGIDVMSHSFSSLGGAILDSRIGINSNYTVQETAYELARQLTHMIVHQGYGHMAQNPLSKSYEECADRTAELLIRSIV